MPAHHPPPTPDFSLLARHNVRVVVAPGFDSLTSALPASLPITNPDTWSPLVLAAEHVTEALARELESRVPAEGGAVAVGAPAADGICDLALRVTAASLDRLCAALRASTGEAAGLTAVMEHAWRSYEAARADRGPTRIMGIVNVTPDSFNPVGRFPDAGAAAEHALRLVGEGADILDIGGESTRPGAEPVSEEEELARVLPVVKRVARETAVPISVDTTKAGVAERCLDAGARWINDVSALAFDPRLASVVARAGATLVLMHMRGTPRTMQQDPTYEDVVADTLRFLRERIAVAVAAGVAFEKIVLDPGFGFGKTVEHNLAILRRLREYTSAGAPILLGTSRKSAIGHVLGGLPPEERLEGTAATVTAAILHGAAILRVHDVQAMRRVAVMTDAIQAGKRTADERR